MSRSTTQLVAEWRVKIKIQELADKLAIISGPERATSILADILIRSRSKGGGKQHTANTTSGGDNRDWTRRRQTNHHTR